MERHANYALVGMVATALLLGGLVFAVWLGGAGVARRDTYRIDFTGPVRGLATGGDVDFNGLKVGEIKHLRLAANDATHVLADVALDRGTPVRVDSLASIEMQGVSSTNIVQISAGSANRPLLLDASRARPPVIRARPDATATLLQGGEEVVKRATEALDRVNRILSDRTVADVAAAARDLRSVADELAANRGMIDHAGSAAAKADRAMDDVRAAAAQVRALADGDGRRAVRSAADAMDELKATVADARTAIAGLSKGGGALSASAAGTLQDLQRTSEALDALIRDIRQDPRGVLGRGSGRTRELKP